MADVGDDRAVSPVFGYALTLSISTLLITGLLVAASGYVESQSRLTAENELNVVGQQVAADLAAADRLSRTDGANPDTLSITRAVPDRIVGSAYRIHLLNDTEGPTQPYLELRAVDPDVTVTVGVPLAPASSVEESSVGGGRFAVEINADGDLVIRDV
jgi:FlaG/FlaF family flagellin (archaellin)